MTDLRTRPVEEQRREEAATGMRTRRGTILVPALVIGVVVGWLAFTSAGPGRAELEQARWQQVVDHYERQDQAKADAEAQEVARWQDVVNHHARRYALVNSKPATERQSAYWEAVVDHYEQRWESQGQ